MQHKAGIYVRVSTEEQAQVVDGSIVSQQHRVKEFVKSRNAQLGKWATVVETYIDDGYSAKDTKRPAYQRMLGDIRSGGINLILVTEISRLSRNTYDFSSLLKELERHKAKFLSVKEQFDTSTPAGEMMVNLMATLAQFERKQTSERVALNFHSRAMRGLRNGSRIVFGYDRDPENPGRFIVNETEAAQVRQIFETYIDVGNLRATTLQLNQSEIRPKKTNSLTGLWTSDAVHGLLRNLAYIGSREVNKKNKREDPETLQPWQRYQVVKASWPAIVSEESFRMVQKALDEAREIDRVRRSKQECRTFLLTGILKCKDCGRALVGHSAHGKRGVHRYYGHKDTPGVPTYCRFSRIPADAIESSVTDHLLEVLFRSGHLDQVEENIRSAVEVDLKDLALRRDQISRQLVEAEGQIEKLLQFQIGLPDDSGSSSIVRDKLDSLASQKKVLVIEREKVLSQLQSKKSIQEARSTIEDRADALRRGWKKATASRRKRLLRGLIEAAWFSPEGLEIRYIIDKSIVGLIPANKTKMAPEVISGAIPIHHQIHTTKARIPTGNVPVSVLPSVVIGGPERDRTADLYVANVALSQLSYWPSNESSKRVIKTRSGFKNGSTRPSTRECRSARLSARKGSSRPADRCSSGFRSAYIGSSGCSRRGHGPSRSAKDGSPRKDSWRPVALGSARSPGANSGSKSRSRCEPVPSCNRSAEPVRKGSSLRVVRCSRHRRC